MAQILKFPFANRIDMPEGAVVLTAQLQGGQAMLWALCDPGAPKKTRKFEYFGTGWEIEQQQLSNYISTLQVDGYVWHIFEVPNDAA